VTVGAAFRRRLAVAVLLAAVVSFIGDVTAGYRGNGDDDDSKAGARSRVTINGGVVAVTLSAAEQENAGIVAVAPTPAPSQSASVGYGTVLDASGLADLAGRYLDAEYGVRTSETKLVVARAAYERAKVLYQDRQNISTAQLQDAEAAFRTEMTALATARYRQRNVVASAKQEWGDVLGNAIVDGAPLITDLIERRAYLIRVTVPLGGMTAAPPMAATTRVGNGPDMTLGFVSPAARADPRLQGFSYLYQVAGDADLLPGFHLHVALILQNATSGLVTLPEAAVVWLQGKAWAYRRTGPTTFERHEISPRGQAPDGGYLIPDPGAGASFVVRGAQMLLSEEFRAQAPIED
jgi:hypothetical protein